MLVLRWASVADGGQHKNSIGSMRRVCWEGIHVVSQRLSHSDLKDYISDTTCQFCRKHAWRLT